MTPRWKDPITGNQIWEADAHAVAATLPDGWVTCAILDGPYGLGKGEWDRIPRGGRLADLYTQTLDDVNRLCAPSATVYIWGTAEGWAELHGVMLGRGWSFAGLLVWDKPDSQAMKSATEVGAWRWVEAAEYCGCYQRHGIGRPGGHAERVSSEIGDNDRNWIRLWLRSEWQDAGLRILDADRALGTNGMAGHYFGRSQWELPTWEAYVTLAAYAMAHGAPRAQPYFVLPDRQALRDSYEALRDSYEALRATFTHPRGVGNVWRATTQSAERLSAAAGGALHPCQKPMLFAERMILASTRPGDGVRVPYGGTCREVVAAVHLARRDPAQARRVIACERNADGVDYLGPVIAQAEGHLPRRHADQLPLLSAPRPR